MKNLPFQSSRSTISREILFARTNKIGMGEPKEIDMWEASASMQKSF